MKKIAVFVCLLFITVTAEAEQTLSDAIALYKAGQKQDSFNILRNLYPSNKTDPDVNFYLGMLFADIGNYSAALPFFTACYAVNPKYAYVASELSNAYIQLRDNKNAIFYGKKSVEDYPDYVEGYLNLCVQLAATGTPEEFTAYLDRAARLDFAMTRNQADTILTQYNLPDLAMRYYRVLEAVNPNDALLLHHIGAVYEWRGDRTKSGEYFARAYRNAVLDADTFFTIYASYMWSLIRAGKYQDIIVSAFVKVPRDYANAHYYTALAYYLLNDTSHFTAFATSYFALSKTPVPADLGTWAEGVLKGK